MRVPSGAIQLTREFRDGRIAESAPQDMKALVAPLTYNETTDLSIKFSYRENIRNGCILMRPCLCSETATEAHLLFPVHRVWPFIRDRVKPGGPPCSPG